MIRIHALNETETDTANDDFDLKAEHESASKLKTMYYEALRYIKTKQMQLAMKMFDEILQTEVIAQITSDMKSNESKSRERFLMKYNCYKHLADLHLQNGDRRAAFDSFLQAREFDCTDVHTMQKFGRIAFDFKYYELAAEIFNQCLRESPKHFQSIDGLLDVLCAQESYLEAYGWALHWYNHFQNYQKALDVILEIRQLLKGCRMLDNMWSIKFLDKSAKRSNEQSLFPGASYDHDFEPIPKPNLDNYRLAEQSWLSFGSMIKLFYENCDHTLANLCTSISFDDICGEIGAISGAISENKNNFSAIEQIPWSFVNTTNSSLNSSVNSQLTASSASGVCLLSSSSAKREFDNVQRKRVNLRLLSVPCRSKAIGEIVKEFVPEYFTIKIDEAEESLPVTGNSFGKPLVNQNEPDCNNNNNNLSYFELRAVDDFQTETTRCFQTFTDELKVGPFCILDLMFKWLKYTSANWHTKLPFEISTLYLDFFHYHGNHSDLNSWDRLTCIEFQSLFQITLLYVELTADRNTSALDIKAGNCYFDKETERLLNHLIATSGFYDLHEDPFECLQMNLRLQLLRFQYEKQLESLESAVCCLRTMQAMLTAPIQIVSINLPNRLSCSLLDTNLIEKELKILNCKRLLCDVQQFYESHQFDKIPVILMEYQACGYDPVQFSAMHQVEMLLESFWTIGRFGDCIQWAEKTLFQSLNVWLQRDANQRRVSKRLLTHIRFTLAYIRELLCNEQNLLKTLGENKVRLVQSIVSLLDIQFSTKYIDRKTELLSSDNLIAILDVILQHDLNSNQTLRHPTVWRIFDKFVNYLVSRENYLADNGRLLLYILDAIDEANAKSLGFDRHKLISQITHYLYGYPRLIAETSSSKPIALNWERAIQLFGFFHSDENSCCAPILPFETKSLILRILKLIPVDMMSQLMQSADLIAEFIDGYSDFPYKNVEISALFPRKVRNLFFLLAKYECENVACSIGDAAKYFRMDLVMCPTRYESWFSLALINIRHLESLYDCNNLFTKKDMQTCLEAIENCFAKCRQLKAMDGEHLLQYGLYLYRFYTTFIIAPFRQHFNEAFPKSSLAKYLEKAKRSFTLALKMDFGSKVAASQRWMCNFLLGKIVEKENLLNPVACIKWYLLAERELFGINSDIIKKIDIQNDTESDNLVMAKLEANFRITAVICKYVSRTDVVVDQELATFFANVLNRPKRIVSYLSKEHNTTTSSTDEPFVQDETTSSASSANKVESVVNLCIRDFQQYLRICPNYYKANYCLIKLYLRLPQLLGNLDNCHKFLLRSNNKSSDVSGLFSLNRSQSSTVFKNIFPMPTNCIHTVVSSHKYMEKCIRILVEYLTLQSNHKLLHVLTLKWIDYVHIGSSTHLRNDQRENLFKHILDSYARVAEHCLNNWVKDKPSTSSSSSSGLYKTKRFLQFFLNIYEIFTKCEDQIKSNDIFAFAVILQRCRELYTGTKQCNATAEENLRCTLAFGKENLQSKKLNSDVAEIVSASTDSTVPTVAVPTPNPSKKCMKLPTVEQRSKLKSQKLAGTSNKSKTIKKERKKGNIQNKRKLNCLLEQMSSSQS